MRKRGIFILGFIGLAIVGAVIGIASIDRPGVENISPSMDLGLYLRVPAGEIEVGDIVEFPIPAWARKFAEERCITGPIMKRVAWRSDGELIVQGDHMPHRSFDSDVYGAIPVDMVTGKFVPLWTWRPETDQREFKGACEQ